MQTIAVIADIHGNIQALEAVLADIEKQGVTEILALGDYVGHGAYPKEVLDRVKLYKAIMGNAEDRILRHEAGEFSNLENILQFQTSIWTHNQLDKDDFDYMRTLPLTEIHRFPNRNMLMAHGTPRNISELVYNDNVPLLKEVLSEIEESVFAYGHTHQARNDYMFGKHIINPGSVGIPFLKKGLTHYALLNYDAGTLKVHQRVIKYNADDFITGMKEKMLPDCGAFAKAIIMSIETGRAETLRFISFAKDIAEKENVKITGMIPNEIWSYADKVFDWIGV